MDITIRHWPISPYAICFLLAFLCWAVYVLLRGRYFAVSWRKTAYSMLLNLVCALSGGKIFTVIEAAARGGRLSFSEAGFTGLGGAVGLLAGTAVFCLIDRADAGLYRDIYAVSMGLLYGISKFGCLFAGCCRGIAWDGPGKIRYLDGALPVSGWLFPVQALEAVSFIVLFALLDRQLRRRSKGLFPMTIVLYSMLKFCLDYARGYEARPFLTVNQAGCLILAAACILAYCFLPQRFRAGDTAGTDGGDEAEVRRS